MTDQRRSLAEAKGMTVLMRNYATVEQARADERRMTKYVCDRIPEDGGRIVLLADGPEAWADLFPSWDEEYGWTLLIASLIQSFS